MWKSHKCGKTKFFKSSIVCGMGGINSEMFEQLNLYFQCVKFTASYLSQFHFMFFVQIFIYLLNNENTKNIVVVAIAGPNSHSIIMT